MLRRSADALLLFVQGGSAVELLPACFRSCLTAAAAAFGSPLVALPLIWRDSRAHRRTCAKPLCNGTVPATCANASALDAKEGRELLRKIGRQDLIHDRGW
jgi:hypothetical protein